MGEESKSGGETCTSSHYDKTIHTYLFPEIKPMQDSFAFAVALLKEIKVSIAPGVAFGNGGEDSVRICYAADRSILEPAMERFCRFVEKIS